MLIPKKDRNAILTYLFKEGVCVAKKDPHGVHAEINVPNLYVMKLMQSLTSKGLVTATFNWSHHYWFLTNNGIEHLREYLGLPEDIVPATLKRKLQTRREGEDRPRGPRFGGKDAAPGEGEFKPTFEGRGRGRGGARGGRGRGGYYRGEQRAEQTQTPAQ